MQKLVIVSEQNLAEILLKTQALKGMNFFASVVQITRPKCMVKSRTNKEIKNYKEEMITMKNDIEKMIEHGQKFKALLITPTNNTLHRCPTPNCECIICAICWDKINENRRNVHSYKCPYCRQIDWKLYMNYVLDTLQIKVLGINEFSKIYVRRCFP